MQQDSHDIVPRERTTQSLLLNKAISIMFSPELTMIILNPLFPSYSLGHIKLCLSHLDYLPWSPQHPLSLYPFHKSSWPSFSPFQSSPLPHLYPLPTVIFLSSSPLLPHFLFSPSLSLDPSPHLSPSLYSLSSTQLPVELDVVQEQADGSVIRSASLHSLSTSPC